MPLKQNFAFNCDGKFQSDVKVQHVTKNKKYIQMLKIIVNKNTSKTMIFRITFVSIKNNF